MSQYSRPDSDISIGNWVDSGGGTVNIYQNIDEVTYSDTDYIKSENNPSSSACEIGLNSVTDPEVGTGHVLNFRILGGGAQTANGNLIVGLYQSSTLIASWTYTNIGTGTTPTVTAKTETLNSTEADSITDYSNLRIKFTATKTAGIVWLGGISWFELQLPDAPAGSGWGNKIQGTSNTNIGKVQSVSKSNISKILGV